MDAVTVDDLERPVNFREEVVGSKGEVGGGVGEASEIVGRPEGDGSFCTTSFTFGGVGPEVAVA